LFEQAQFKFTKTVVYAENFHGGVHSVA